MADIRDQLTTLLHERAELAPAVPTPGPDLVRSVRRRQGLRVAVAVGGAAALVAGVVGVGAALVADPVPDRVRPAAEPTLPIDDDRYEFCPKANPVTTVAVSTFGTELKFDRGCFFARGGVALTLRFTNRTTELHNVVVARDGDEPFAKTETVFANSAGTPGSDTITLQPLVAGDYSLTCDIHPTMHSQLVVR